ncbi:hypothetical protein Ciccas_008580 [Cichlidogyrus casuarinus]|uniref:Uncharacterized protein n=1 Tax=Cichlidogyrus casuarinus TaxID=1844966 RepID=A0ABD2Q262_9PLAT
MLETKRKLLQESRHAYSFLVKQLPKSQNLLVQKKEELQLKIDERIQLDLAVRKIEAALVRLGKEHESLEKTLPELQEEVSTVEDQVTAHLAPAIPGLDKAIAVCNEKLTLQTVSEVEKLQEPEDSIVKVVFGIYCFMAPDSKRVTANDCSWKRSGLNLLANIPIFLAKFKSYEKEKLNPNFVKLVPEKIDLNSLNPDSFGQPAVVALAHWLKAMMYFYELFMQIEKEREDLATKKAALAEKEAEFLAVKKKQNRSEANLKTAIENLEQAQLKCLSLAGSPMKNFEIEQTNWLTQLDEVAIKEKNSFGDSLLLSTMVNYFGFLKKPYRDRLCMIYKWFLNSLPQNNFALENAAFAFFSLRVPLILDPEMRAKKWLLQGYGPEAIVVEATDPNFESILESAMNKRTTLIVANIKERCFNQKLYALLKDGNRNFLHKLRNFTSVLDFDPSDEQVKEEFLKVITRSLYPEEASKAEEAKMKLCEIEIDLLNVEIALLKRMESASENLINDREAMEFILKSKNQDEMVFLLALAFNMQLEAKSMSLELLNFFTSTSEVVSKLSPLRFLSNKDWSKIIRLTRISPCFKGLDKELGHNRKKFVNPVTMANAYGNKVPTLFILNPGSSLPDIPNLESISLGEDQDDQVRNLIDMATQSGHWIMLDNAHLVPECLLDNEQKILNRLGEAHKDFRVFLTCMKATLFNTLRQFDKVPMFDENFSKVLFALCFFHSSVKERCSLWPIGWTYDYEFNFVDLKLCHQVLEKEYEASTTINWLELKSLLQHTIYGGRILNDCDKRIMKTLVEKIMNPNMLNKIGTHKTMSKYILSSIHKINNCSHNPDKDTQQSKIVNKLGELLHLTPDLITVTRAQVQAIKGNPALHMMLFQECQQMNKLLTAIPREWKVLSFPCKTCNLDGWFRDLLARHKELYRWAQELTLPRSFWLGGLFNPQAFFLAFKQDAARRLGIGLDEITITSEVMRQSYTEFEKLPCEGHFVHGIFLEGARWDRIQHCLCDPLPMKPVVPIQGLHLKAIVCKDECKTVKQMQSYLCPVYCTNSRIDEFVTELNLRTLDKPEKWILAGVALLLQNVDYSEM